MAEFAAAAFAAADSGAEFAAVESEAADSEDLFAAVCLDVVALSLAACLHVALVCLDVVRESL